MLNTGEAQLNRVFYDLFTAIMNPNTMRHYCKQLNIFINLHIKR